MAGLRLARGRRLADAANSQPRGDPGDAQGSRVSQPVASGTLGPQSLRIRTAPPTLFGDGVPDLSRVRFREMTATG